MNHFSKVASWRNMEAETEIPPATETVLARQPGVDRPVTEALATERAATATTRSRPRHWLGVRDPVEKEPEPRNEVD